MAAGVQLACQRGQQQRVEGRAGAPPLGGRGLVDPEPRDIGRGHVNLESGGMVHTDDAVNS
jgi:hypothetical protein